MKKIIAEPKFVKQMGRVNGVWDAQMRRIIRGKNAAIFHCYLYSALFGGEVCKAYKGDTERILYCVERNFHPDVILTEKTRKIFTEEKTMSNRDRRPQCSFKQIENYSHHLLDNLDRFKRICSLDYAFFTYRESKKSLDVVSNKNLEKYLAENTKELIIVPSNLLFLVLSHSEIKVHDQTTNKGPDAAFYFRPYASTMTALSKDGEALERMKTHSKNEKFTPMLLLDDLHCERYPSPRALYSHEHRIEPFNIIRYFNADERAWADSFKKNHQTILTEMLKVDDLYQKAKEQEDVPF